MTQRKTHPAEIDFAAWSAQWLDKRLARVRATGERIPTEAELAAEMVKEIQDWEGDEVQDFLPRPEPGWLGAFSRAQAIGALPNGSRVIKTNSEPGDGTPDGTPGVVLGSGDATHPDIPGGGLLYWIEWANRPRVAIGVLAGKLRPANG